MSLGRLEMSHLLHSTLLTPFGLFSSTLNFSRGGSSWCHCPLHHALDRTTNFNEATNDDEYVTHKSQNICHARWQKLASKLFGTRISSLMRRPPRVEVKLGNLGKSLSHPYSRFHVATNVTKLGHFDTIVIISLHSFSPVTDH